MDPGAAVASPCHEIPSRRAAVILSGIGNLQPPEGRKAVIGDVATIAIGARDHETRIARVHVDRPVEAARGPRVRKKGLGWEGRTAEAPSGVGRSIEKGVPRRIDDARIRGRDPGALGSLGGNRMSVVSGKGGIVRFY